MIAIDWDVTATDLCLAGDEACDVASTCTECNTTICPVHCDEFTTCASNEDLFHCLDCASSCVECAGAGAQDDYDDRCELDLRGDY